MRLEELATEIQVRITNVVAMQPPHVAGSQWRVFRIEPWINAGENSLWVVDLTRGEGYTMKGLLVFTPLGDLFLPDANGVQLLASWYTDMSLERYNAGHDPHYRGCDDRYYGSLAWLELQHGEAYYGKLIRSGRKFAEFRKEGQA